MPAYLIRGFRWHRRSIRRHIAQHDVDEATADWVSGRGAGPTLVSLAALYPDVSRLQLLEQYDAADEAAAAQPWAFVADRVVEVRSSVDVGRVVSGWTGRLPPLEALRDRLEVGEEVKWWIVRCDDLDRGTDGLVTVSKTQISTIHGLTKAVSQEYRLSSINASLMRLTPLGGVVDKLARSGGACAKFYNHKMSRTRRSKTQKHQRSFCFQDR
ncbi:MAG: hypothetical protein M1833_000480 [Piccolia ochrophora]|nr:MAG: hypothetical protein M1833_000480 [Piccolia ochrophora]